jgi:hypothetical protein
VKLTDPVGDAAFAEKVAVSLTDTVLPVTAVAGFATVVIVGDAMATEICSLASVQMVVTLPLLASPGYDARHE